MENYLSSIYANSEYAQNEFGNLSDEQFNWKPSADKWSVAQCILHLVKTNKGYFPLYDRLLSGHFEPNFFEKTGWFADFWGKTFVNGASPKSTRKLIAPKSVRPQQSHIDKSIIAKLVEQNQKIGEYYRQIETKGLGNTVISSPMIKLVVYRTSCSFDIVNLHEQRHLQQAKRVKDLLK